MPIPDFNNNGLLPVGIFECTMKELQIRFGRFQSSDLRVKLFELLENYVNELKFANNGKFLIIDGSFTTNKENPSDIDLLLVFKDDVNFEKPVPPCVYNVRSKKYLRKKYPFDIFFGFEEDDSTKKIIDLFLKVKGKPDLRKGFLKIIL